MNVMRVLVIDDEPDIREIATVSLQLTKHWTVFTASTGSEGTKIASAFHPDVILLDVVMPQDDGLATLEHLKKIEPTKRIPVILMTAASQLAAEYDTLKRYIRGILVKPFDPGTLGDQIESLLACSAPYRPDRGTARLQESDI